MLWFSILFNVHIWIFLVRVAKHLWYTECLKLIWNCIFQSDAYKEWLVGKNADFLFSVWFIIRTHCAWTAAQVSICLLRWRKTKESLLLCVLVQTFHILPSLMLWQCLCVNWDVACFGFVMIFLLHYLASAAVFVWIIDVPFCWLHLYFN